MKIKKLEFLQGNRILMSVFLSLYYDFCTMRQPIRGFASLGVEYQSAVIKKLFSSFWLHILLLVHHVPVTRV